MTTHGTRETPFWTNEDGFLEWVDLLNRTAEDESDTLPLTWIPRMMEHKRDHRPTARGLFTEISEPTAEVKYLFCGLCCADDDSTESVNSSAGSIEANAPDTGGETTIETRSDAKRPSPSESQTELTMNDEAEPDLDSETEAPVEKSPRRPKSSPKSGQNRDMGSAQSPLIRFESPDESVTQEIEEEDETQTVTPAPFKTADLDELQKYRPGEIIPRDPNYPAATSEQYERQYHGYLELRNDPTTNIQMAFNAYLVHLDQQLQWDKASNPIPPIEAPPALVPEQRSASAEPEQKRSPALLSPDEIATKHKRSVSDSRRNAVMLSPTQPWIPPILAIEIDGEEIYPKNRMVRTLRVASPEDWTVSWPEDAYQKLAASPYIPAVDILILAIRRRHISQIAWLLEKSPDPKMRDMREWSPLHYASASGDVEIMTMLVKAGFQFWASKSGVQPIHLAVKNGHLAAVRYLLSLGANLNVQDSLGTPAKMLSPHHMDTAFYNISAEAEEVYLDGQSISRDQYLVRTRPNTDLSSLYTWNLDRNLILIHACRTGNINEVCSILAGEYDAAFVDAAGYSALHFAASFGHSQICALLLTAGFDNLLQSASGGFRPIHYANLYLDKLIIQQDSDDKKLSWREGARLEGYRNTVKTLQQHNISSSSLKIKAKDSDLRSAADSQAKAGQKRLDLNHKLREAAGSGNVNEVKRCLQDGAEVNGCNVTQETALHKAAASGYIEIVTLLVEAGGALDMADRQGRSPFYRAVQNNHDAVVTYMMLRNAPMLHGAQKKEPAIQLNPERDSEILSFAARTGNISVVCKQLLKGADVNKKLFESNTPLHEAVLGRNTEVARLLIKNGADLRAMNGAGKLPLNLAFDSGQQEMCLLLSTAARDSTSLENAVRKGDLSKTLDLLKGDTSVRGEDSEGFTLLHHASILGYMEIAAALIDRGAVLDSKVPEFLLTPLHYAIRKGHQAIVELLGEKGADINALGFDDQTPVMMAVLAANAPALAYLIRKGADLNHKDVNGTGALKYAATKHDAVMVKMLFDANAAWHPPMGREELETYLGPFFPGLFKPVEISTTMPAPSDEEPHSGSVTSIVRALEVFKRSRDRVAGK